MDTLIFSEEIKKGTGKAFQMLQKNAGLISKEVEDILYNASINNLAYDAQCEGARADYLFRIINIYSNKDAVVERLLDYFKRMRKNDWGAYQLFDLLGLFNSYGIINSKNLLYRKTEWYLNHYKNEDVPGTSTLIQMDGVKGFLFIAERIGELLENSDDLWVTDFYLNEVNTLTKKDCYTVLAEKSKTNKYLRNYKKKIDSEKRRKFRELPVDSLSTMLKKIKRNENIRLYWGKKVDKNILQQFAKKFLLYENDNHIEKGLRIFSKVKFPLGYKLLLPYLESSRRKNINYTLECLAFFKNNTVRQIGLKYIRNKAFNESALKIFEKNFYEEDIELFNDLLMTNNEVEFHGVSFGINDIFHENRSPKAKPLLRRMYDRLYCSMCRLSTIEAMKRSEVLDNNIINEMQFDSYEETRKLYKKIISKGVNSLGLIQ